jgi:hypothetical protein
VEGSTPIPQSCWELFLKRDSGFFEKKSDTINQNPTCAEKELYSAVCQKILAGNQKKKTVGKTTDHEGKMTHQNEVLLGKIKLKIKRMMEQKQSATELFEKNTQSHAAPGQTKEKGIHCSLSRSSDN